MVFSSTLFVIYFLPVFLLIYHLLPNKFRNYFLLLASILFYAWGAPKFIFVVLGSMTVNFFVIDTMYKTSKRNLKISLVTLSLIINIGLLAFFKYANFFVDNVNRLLELLNYGQVAWVRIALPIGISFFTFQSITYSVDVYRNVHPPLKKLPDFFLYLLMFPQLIAGPIVRFNTIADQIVDRRENDTINNFLTGLYRFIIGLSKKIFIANTLGAEVDRIFALPVHDAGSISLWMATIAYSFQIYFDFSGYSDMAIGIGKMIGFRFPENFNNPYTSGSITEFWKRWHMTLGAWMKDYLYIPLGGNRVNTRSRLYFNLIVVFLISGLWHGASWNFVLWGAYHGLFLILDRIFLLKLLKSSGKFISVMFTYIITLFGWVIFRIENIDKAGQVLKSMILFNNVHYSLKFPPFFWLFLVIGFVFSFITLTKTGKKMETFFFERDYNIFNHAFLIIMCAVLYIVSLSFIVSTGFNPFIYFRF